jgi:hypothetical protein
MPHIKGKLRANKNNCRKFKYLTVINMNVEAPKCVGREGQF